MRITVTFADDVAAELQRLQRERSIGLNEAVNELVRAGVARKQERQAASRHQVASRASPEGRSLGVR
jgi:metal-responsive CopG/Arc/MetJ family transcriptional regulator